MVKRPLCRTKMSLTRILFLSVFFVGTITSGVTQPTCSEVEVTKTCSPSLELSTRQEVLDTIVDQINETRLTWFDSILTNTIGPRPYNSTTNVQAAEFIAEELNVTKRISASYQWFTYAGKKIANVIGVLPSADPNNQSKIVVGAHFDTVSNSTGADDNGSGTAALLEVAKVLSLFRFDCTIEFVAFNAEEVGLVGSRYYVQKASQANEDILLAINVDMCLWNNPTAPSNEKLWFVYNGTVPYEDCERFADIALNVSYTYTRAPIQKISTTNEIYGPAFNWRRSDHASFWDEGVPALWVFEFNGFQNPYIHTPADSMDVKSYNFTLCTKVAQLVAATVAKLACIRAERIVPDQYERIQWAINNASDGDTVFVRAGTYYENVVLNKQNLALMGENKSTTVIDGNGKPVVSLKANNTKIKGFTVQNGCSGVLMYPWTYGHIISDNLITNNDEGIAGHYDCVNISILDNIIASNNFVGIWMLFSQSMIRNNLISDNGKGDFREYGSGILISKGVNSRVVYCVDNTILGNTIKNHKIGIWGIYYSQENLFFHNNFVNNTNQFSTPATTWNNTATANYWSNYKGTDANHDGIGDTPHEIDANITDPYPLMGMFHSFDASLDYDVNVISNSTIENFHYFESNSTIRMHVSNMTANQTFGFCRVPIPKSLMPPPYTVVINDGLTEVLYFNETIYDNNTHRWIYFAYEHSTNKIVIVPEFPSFLILPLFMIATLPAITLYRRKHIK